MKGEAGMHVCRCEESGQGMSWERVSGEVLNLLDEISLSSVPMVNSFSCVDGLDCV
jgi:hypothetical protein